MDTSRAWDYGRNLPPCRWSELPDFQGGAFPSPIRLTHTGATLNRNLWAVQPEYVDDPSIEAAMKGFFFENLHFEIEIDPKSNAGQVAIGYSRYDLAKLHFHIPAEHSIDGELSKMEVHLVHRDLNSKGVVIGIMVEELTPALQASGHVASPLIEFFHKQLPKVTLPGANAPFLALAAPPPNSLNDGFPSRDSYFRYQGGLTTPPCSEPVHFYILDSPIYTTAKILEQFASYVPGGNNRPLQLENGRLVEYFPG